MFFYCHWLEINTSVAFSQPNPIAHIFSFYSTSPGFASSRDKHKGSPYIQNFCSEICHGKLQSDWRDLREAHSKASKSVGETSIKIEKEVETRNKFWILKNKETQIVPYKCSNQAPKYEETGSCIKFGLKTYSDDHVIVDIYVSKDDKTYSDLLMDLQSLECKFKVKKENSEGQMNYFAPRFLIESNME